MELVPVGSTAPTVSSVDDSQSVINSTSEYGQFSNICYVSAFIDCSRKSSKLLYFMLQLAVQILREVSTCSQARSGLLAIGLTSLCLNFRRKHDA